MLPFSDSFIGVNNTLLPAYNADYEDCAPGAGIYNDGTDHGVYGYNPGEAGVGYTGDSFPNDQFSEVTAVFTSGTDSLIGPAVRCDPDTGSYFTFYGNADEIWYHQSVGGVGSDVGPAMPGISPGDVMRLEAVGSTYTGFINGVACALGPVVDASLAAGFGGLGLYKNNPTLVVTNLLTGGLVAPSDDSIFSFGGL